VFSIPSEYRRTPVLSEILRFGPEHANTILRVLVPISRCSCFTSEFTRAEGHRLLPHLISPLHLEATAEMIITAISASRTYLEIRLWLTLFINCLISVGTGLEKMESEKTEALKPNLLRLARLIDSMKEQRHENNSESKNTVGEREAVTKENLKCDASLWSPEEWSEVQYLIERLNSVGLPCGYISFDSISFKKLDRFARDPDGLCPHRKPFDSFISVDLRRRFISFDWFSFEMLERLAKDPDGLRFARDPDGLCSHSRP
jgi:hypothetical protein